MTAWTREMGASASAATWRTQATSATPKPIVHHLEANNPFALATGRRTLTSRRCYSTPVLP